MNTLKISLIGRHSDLRASDLLALITCALLQAIISCIRLLLSPGRVRSIVMSMTVCLSACISAKPHGRTSPIFMFPAVVARSLSDVMYFRFCG